MDYRRFDPSGCNFPPPAVPLLPAPDWSSLGAAGNGTVDPALLDGTGVRHFSRGRYALHEAFRNAGVGVQGALLAPAYHCRTMIDPALALGAEVRLFAVNPDLTPDLDSIAAALAATPQARALVLPHYFGIEQPAALTAAIASLCRRHGATLVEDCSHAWQVAALRAPMARADKGHAVVASPYKFFACEDGGVLWSGADPAPAPPRRRSLIDEAKGVKSAWTRSRVAHTAPARRIGPGGSGACGVVLAEGGSQPSPMYQRACEGQSSLALSRWVMRHTRLAPLVDGRRRNYRWWAEAVAGLAGARALFPELPAGCAPYMFPLEISMPDPFFFALKRAGLPVWRWDDMAVSDCGVADRYRLHLLHLPCHQGLSGAQMTWMTSLVKEVLA